MASSALPSSTISTLLPPLPKFNGTCVPIQYPCYPGTRYIDPCDCKFYFLCRNTGSIVRLSCIRGTAFDHTTSQSFCQRMSTVVGKAGKCDQALPWERCQDRHGAAADLQKLQSWCTSSGYLTPPPPRGGRDDGANAGAIAAIIILLLLLVVVIVLSVIYVRKKGNPLAKVKDTNCWLNVVWCWKEVVCCGSGGGDYYYEDEDEQQDDVDNSSRRSSSPTHPRVDDLPPPSVRRSSSTRKEKERGVEGEDGTYHDFGDTKVERRMSARRSQVAIADNPAFNPNFALHDDDPPPDTKKSPAPPAYSSRAREVNKMDHDLIEAAFEEEVFPMGKPRLTAWSARSIALSARSTRSHSMPTFHLGGDSEDGDISESSFVA